ncbi:hypothetical protein [Clostridium algidicarnis]|nr:hypothetical protein [Clostridium algidicarnis]
MFIKETYYDKIKLVGVGYMYLTKPYNIYFEKACLYYLKVIV